MIGTKKIDSFTAEVFIEDDSFTQLNGFLETQSFDGFFILVDSNTLVHCLPKLVDKVGLLKRAKIVQIKSGEEYKNTDTCREIWKELTDYQATRGALLINLGGGVVTDIGGFVASTYKRGMNFIHIPTSLLAQVDASIGGKVGVDFDEVKNMVGLFSEPRGIFVYPHLLGTLGSDHMTSGYAEILKHGLVCSREYWLQSRDISLFDQLNWTDLIMGSIEIKNSIVKRDPHDLNERKLLNYGHTVGHAIESYFLREGTPILHGNAIAVGMICEAYLSHKLGGLSLNELDEVKDTILTYFEKLKIDQQMLPGILEFMRQDKKNYGGAINFTLLKEIGCGEINYSVGEEQIKEALAYYSSL